MIDDWTLLDPGADLGRLPDMLSDTDPRPAREQFDAAYPFGGTWRSHPARLDEKVRLCYPGDPPLDPVALTIMPLTREVVLVYPGSFVVIKKMGGGFVFQRMD